MFLLVVAVVGLIRRARKLGRRIDSLTQGSDAQSLESVLGSHLERVRQVVNDVNSVSARTAMVERDLQSSLARIGLVRFNPFEETGGNQSFALAMTDIGGDGFVVSSLHSRTGTRLYAKAVTAGRSDAALSAEEGEALRQALAAPVAQPSGGSPGRRDRAGAAV